MRLQTCALIVLPTAMQKSIAKNAVMKSPGKEQKNKTAGKYIPSCDHVPMLTWDVVRLTTIPDELREFADHKTPLVIVVTKN